MNKAVIDTSSLLYAWDNYPIKQFPKVWKWLARLLTDGDIVILKIVEDELKYQYSTEDEIEDEIEDDSCFTWISNYEHHELPPEAETKAEEIHTELEIIAGEYSRKGVGENDILIIAFAAVKNLEVITNEDKQKTRPGGQSPEKRNYKIPRACKEVGIRNNYNFLTLLKNSQEMFQSNNHLHKMLSWVYKKLTRLHKS